MNLDAMNLDEMILQHFGGVENNSLDSIVESSENRDDNIRIVQHSAYHDNEKFEHFLYKQENQFTIFSSNINSINSKFNEILSFVELHRRNNFEFNALCFQECWITDNQDVSHIQIDGYTCIYQGRSCSVKGGLVIYLQDIFKYKILSTYNTSTIWEGLFIDIFDGGLSKTLTLGNIYRPLQDIINNYRTFIQELTPFLNVYENNGKETVLTGDFNINLLKLNERDIFSDFYDTITSHSFFPAITLPTRFSARNASLIDNFFCKLTETSLTAIPGILIDQLSDHHPYFLVWLPIIKTEGRKKGVVKSEKKMGG